MYLPNETSFLNSLTAQQRFCVEVWYGQTFSASLDSYRVRLHNGLTILKEFHHEIKTELCSGAELQAIALEALELCKKDEVLRVCLGNALDTLITTLTDFHGAKNIYDAKSPSLWLLDSVKKLRFFFEDTLEVAEKKYLKSALEIVRQHIGTDAHPFILLRNGISCLLTNLMDRGWTLESLHEWALNLAGHAVHGHSFEERFRFMERQIMRDQQPFTVCLRLTGDKSLSELGSFKGWNFSPEGVQIINAPREMKLYLRTHPQTSFATCRIESVDFKSACHVALESFEHCLDRLRFNFLDTRLQLDSRVLVVREGDNRPRLERVAFPVPNPVFTTNLAQFRRNSERIDELLRNGTLHQTSRERIAAAARHYRLGKDAETYRDKLLNWWFGLEYLTKINAHGSIGGTVTEHGASCMTARYLLLLLLDLEPTIHSLLGTWPTSVTSLLGCEPSAYLRPEKLLTVMQNAGCRSDIEIAIANRPWLLVRFQELADVLSNAKKLSQYVEKHGQRVGWQLKRLYRVRCSLVHGSPIILRLMLLCANLEFYLRETMVITLRTLLSNPQVSSLGDFFDRLKIALTQREKLLAALQNGTAPDSSCCFDGIVTAVDD